MRESLTKRGELVHNLEILSEISPWSGTGSCPCWFEDGWGTLSYSYLKMVNSFTKNLTENLPKDKGTLPLSTTPMQRGIEIAGAGQDRVAEGRLTRETVKLSFLRFCGLVSSLQAQVAPRRVSLKRFEQDTSTTMHDFT